MAFSVSTKRSKSQDSPMLWLSLLAGSLLLHLVLLLLGRWYLSQTASAPAGMSQAPLDFVEIDPNAPPLKQAPSIAPSNPQTQPELPKATPQPPQPSQPTVTDETQPSDSIANLPRQSAPERSQPRITPSPSPTPATPVNQPNRTQSAAQQTPQPGELPNDRTTPQRNPAAPSRPTTKPTPDSDVPGSSTSGSSTPGTTTPGTATPGTTTPGTTTPSPGSPNPTQPGDPTKPNTGASGDPNSSGATGTPLTVATSVRGEVVGRLEEDTFRPEQYARGTITFKSSSLSEINFDYPTKLPVKVLELRLGLIIGQDGAVTPTVRDDSPTLQKYPDLQGDVKAIVDQLIPQALADGSLAFDIKLEADSKVDAYRIMNIRILVAQ